MSTVINMSDRDVAQDSLRIAFGDNCTTIVKTVGRENRTITITNDEKAKLLLWLIEDSQTLSPAS